ncbi:hypothetical protein AK830_g2843 [Neonectria ditissima]|uniref:Zn(2)-C6 fungal-type domain-containing protein n=1 Tax=Neonectria ditissima TaxID=78410 RepID=A0A0P7BR63_9HYPO|nr:hypothetical protein AK830_g2843 [Neonectria ditissima]
MALFLLAARIRDANYGYYSSSYSRDKPPPRPRSLASREEDIAAGVMARIGHKKSRNGCSRCKERRVKCDEKRPCSACVKLRDCCSLVKSSGSSSGQPGGQDHTDPRLMNQRKDIGPVGSIPSPPFTDAAGLIHPVFASSPFSHIANPAPELPSSWTADLNLMNHYTTLTSGTLPGASQRVWQTEVPKEAVAHPFLMHQILAVSAFHLASLQPAQSQAHFTQAFQHQQHAIGGINAEVSHVTSRNCHALFAASSLLFIGSFAVSTPALHKTRQRAVDNMVDIFTLVRGVSSILSSSKEEIRHGVLGDFMECDFRPRESALLTLLLEKLPEIRPGLDANGVNPEAQAVVEEAVAGLRKSVDMASAATPELNVAIIWPMTLKDDFLAMLRVHHPAALVIVSHYCAVLHAAGSDYWFMEGWGRCVTLAIAESLAPSWQGCIQWPLASVS